jgi:hypothetical protein
VILLLLEVVRFFQVRSFLKHVHAGQELLAPAAVDSLGKHHRRGERRGRRRVEESSEDEKALLSV